MGTGVKMIVAGFKDEATAEEAFKHLKQGANNPWLQDAAVIARHGNKVTFKESRDMGFAKGAVAGGAVGALTALIFPPAIVLTTVGGALIGGIGAKARDANLPDKELKALGESLPDGRAAIVAVVAEDLFNQATDALKRLGAAVTTEGLDGESVARLQKQVEELRAAQAAADAAKPAG